MCNCSKNNNIRKDMGASLVGEEVNRYKKYAEEYLSYLYPSLADQIIEETGILKGEAIEIGTGTGFLAIELIKKTNLKIYVLDISEDMIRLTKNNVRESGFSKRILVEKGDAHKLPFDSNFADLIVSHGSLHHWMDPTKVFKEIYRVLKPQGISYIIDLRRDAPTDLTEKFINHEAEFSEYTQKVFQSSYTITEVKSFLKKSNIKDYDVSIFKLNDQVIVNNIATLIKSPVRDSSASKISLRILIKKL